MEFTPLKTDYKDDILNSSNTRRKYQEISNSDGSKSFSDMTEYSQVGDSFGAKELNEERVAINEIVVELNEVRDNLNANRATANQGGTVLPLYPSIYIYRSGQVVFIRCSGNMQGQMDANIETVVATSGSLDQKYIPTSNIIAFLPFNSNGDLVRIEINTNGEISFMPTSDIASGAPFNLYFTYFTGKNNFD